MNREVAPIYDWMNDQAELRKSGFYGLMANGDEPEIDIEQPPAPEIEDPDFRTTQERETQNNEET